MNQFIKFSLGLTRFYSAKSNSINLAIVGLGRAGQIHLNNAIVLPEYSIKYVVDNDEQRALQISNRYKLEKGSWEQVLNDKNVNAVIISNPTKFHFKFTMEALDAGKHILVEKPITQNINEAKQIFQKQKEKNLVLYTGYNRSYDPSFSSLMENIREKGEQNLIKFVRKSSRDFPRNSNEYLKTAGGIVSDQMCHDIVQVLQIFQELPQEIYAIGCNYDEILKQFNEHDQCVVMMKFGEAVGIIDASREAKYGYDSTLEIFTGNQVYKEENKQKYFWTVNHEKGKHESRISEGWFQRFKDSFYHELIHWAKAINNQPNFARVAPDLKLTENLFIVIDAINKSMKTKEKMILK